MKDLVSYLSRRGTEVVLLVLTVIVCSVATEAEAKSICMVAGVSGNGYTTVIERPIRQMVMVDGHEVNSIVGSVTIIYCNINGRSYFVREYTNMSSVGSVVLSDCRGQICNINISNLNAMNNLTKLTKVGSQVVGQCRGKICVVDRSVLAKQVALLSPRLKGPIVIEHPRGVSAVQVANGSLRVQPNPDRASPF